MRPQIYWRSNTTIKEVSSQTYPILHPLNEKRLPIAALPAMRPQVYWRSNTTIKEVHFQTYPIIHPLNKNRLPIVV